MAEYAIKCETCGHRGDVVQSVHEDLVCPECGKAAAVDWERQNAPATDRTWTGNESVSMTERFDPAGIADIKRQCPSAEFTTAGRLKFKGDRHQRKVYREFGNAISSVKERKAERESKKQEDHQ